MEGALSDGSGWRGGVVLGVAAVLLASCTATTTTSDPAADTTGATTSAPAALSEDTSGLGVDWEPAPFVESSPEAAMALAPPPAPGLCVDVFDLNFGDTTEPVEVRATFGAPGVEGPLAGVVTLQEWEDPASAAVNFGVLVTRNNLGDDFPSVPGAKARITGENPFPESEGTPVAFVRGSWTVLVSVAPDFESALADWARQVDAFLLDGASPATAEPCSPA